MENKKTNSTTTSKYGKKSKEKSTNASMESAQPMKLFEDEQKDLYWANI